MKKVKATIILVAIQMVMILNEMFQTIGSLKFFNVIDDGRNTTPMRALKDESLKCKVLSGTKTVNLANDRSGKKNFGFVFIWNTLVIHEDQISNVKSIILMSTWTPIVTATIDAPDDAEGRATCAEHIQTAAAKTLYITIPPILYGTVLTGLIAAMRAAVGVNQVIKAWGDLNKQLKKIMALVQAAMDEDTTGSAAIICEYYSFHVKGKGGRTGQVFSGHPGVAAGEIDLEFPIGPQGCCYDIKLYNADRTAFVRAQPNDLGHATIGGLVSGSTQNVSVTIISHGVAEAESQIINVPVK